MTILAKSAYALYLLRRAGHWWPAGGTPSTKLALFYALYAFACRLPAQRLASRAWENKRWVIENDRAPGFPIFTVVLRIFYFLSCS